MIGFYPRLWLNIGGSLLENMMEKKQKNMSETSNWISKIN
jgi:hypothetical protein